MDLVFDSLVVIMAIIFAETKTINNNEGVQILSDSPTFSFSSVVEVEVEGGGTERDGQTIISQTTMNVCVVRTSNSRTNMYLQTGTQKR